MKDAVESVARMKDVTDMTPAASSPLHSEAESAFQVLKVALREYRLVKDTSFSELEELHELEAGSALHKMINLVLADTLYNSCSASG